MADDVFNSLFVTKLFCLRHRHVNLSDDVCADFIHFSFIQVV